MGNYLALDFGASSGRGIIGRFDGKRFTLEEVHRFSNDPVIASGMMSWDVLRLFFETKAALAAAAAAGGVISAAIDTWGVDYGYIDRNGMLMANPCHYRDSRTEGMGSELSTRIPQERLYEITGVMPQSINTIYQLTSDCIVRPWLPDNAKNILMMPDLLAYMLTGEVGCEYTIASTGGYLDARWSIMGVETDAPVISKESFAGGFSNEGGAFGDVTLIRNIMGLWLEQESRRQWKREGRTYSFDDLSRAAEASEPCRSIIVPDDQVFSPAGDMPGRIADYCRRTGQRVPETHGEIVRCIFDSLALCYRHTAEKLESLSGKKYPKIYVVGGGTKEKLLSQITADCTGKVVAAGPAEATAFGNIAIQALASGEIGNAAELKEILANADEVQTFEPNNSSRDMWDDAYERYLKLAK